MLNYIVLYLCQYLMQQVMPESLRNGADTTKDIPANGSLHLDWLSRLLVILVSISYQCRYFSRNWRNFDLLVPHEENNCWF